MKKLLFLVLTLFIIGNTVNSQTFTYSLNTSVLKSVGGNQFADWDGYWNTENNNDEWDGTGIGAGRPGGVSIVDGYYRIQDCGNPNNYGMPDPSNRKIFGYMDLTNFAGGSPTLLDDGATIHFVARLATDGPLDTLYPQTSLYPSGTVPATGDGYLLASDGMGTFGIEAGPNAWISFVLRTENDTCYGDVAQPVGNVAGLQMNPLMSPGNIATGFGSADGTFNIIELDPTVWHDFWITIKKDATNTGTHEVSVSVDGAPAEIFIVTSSNLDNHPSINTLFMGCASTDQSGAIDIKAFDFAPGILAPPAVPVAHWAFEGDATDEYGISDGTLINGDTSSYVEGLEGLALDLPAGSPVRYIEVPDTNIIDFDTNSFTISMLVNIPDFAGNHELIFKGNNDDAVDGHWYCLALHDNNLIMTVDDKVNKMELIVANIDQVMTTDAWNHIVAVRDRELDKLILYANGNEVGSINDATETSISSAGHSLRIGTNATGDASEARQIDEMLLYRVALSPEEISSLYNSYFPKEIADNVVAYWKLDGDATDVRATSDGTLMGGADTNYVEGLDGQALDLSKGTDPTYVEVADNQIINLDTSDFTYSLLLNITDFASNREIIFKGTTAGECYALALIENTLRFFVDDNITNTNLDFAEANLHLYDTTWNHIAAIRDRSQDSIFLYINQRWVGSLKDDTEESIGSTLPLIIGAGGNKDVKFDGMLDEVRLYNEALSLFDLKSLSSEYGIEPKYIESTNANLRTITIIPAATLTPAFDKDVTEYTAVLPEGTTSVKVTAMPADFKSKITGTGDIDVSSGSGTAAIVVTAENGTTVKTYTINFTITGIDNIFGDGSKVIYNPMENCLIFINIDNISRVEIYNLAGMKLIEKNNVSDRMSLNDANLRRNDIFIVRIITNNEYGVMKFVK